MNDSYRIACFSDIHGNDVALEAVLSDIRNEGVDAHLCMGDLVAFGPRPQEVLDRLESLKNLTQVRGNTDRWLRLVHQSPQGPFAEKIIDTVKHALAWTIEHIGTDEVLRLDQLPATATLECFSETLFAAHAFPDNDCRALTPQTTAPILNELFVDLRATVYVCGHTHESFQRSVEDRMVLNVGSVGLPYDGTPQPTWVLLEFNSPGFTAQIRRVEYDYPAVVRDIVERKMAWGEVVARRIKSAIRP